LLVVIERHHKVLVRRVIKEVYGASEDELTDEKRQLIRRQRRRALRYHRRIMVRLKEETRVFT